MSDTTSPPAAAVLQESYIVSEGKKRGSTREVRDEAAFDRFYTVGVRQRCPSHDRGKLA